MRLTFEALGRTFILALERDEESAHEPNLAPSDLSSDTERADTFDFDKRPPIRIGFVTSKEQS